MALLEKVQYVLESAIQENDCAGASVPSIILISF